ncbi:polysaccharide polymerase [Lactiplantibacillus plantarum subsp. plantarum]|nr:polysaccharide polymerase [Lactiplantibacillus plantarum subsp. plantarum]
MALLYGTIIASLTACHKKSGKVVRDSKIFLAFGVVLLIANYKGEVARSGMVLTAIIFLGYLLSTELKIEEKKWQSA